MDRAYIELNLPNLVAVVIMATLGMLALNLVLTTGGKYFGKAA